LLKPESSKTALIAGGILLVLGFMILSPSARFLCLILGVICAMLPALFGPKRQRLIAIILLILTLGAAVWTYPQFKEHMDAYRRSVRSHSK
jgi:hypothetical protein